ncbi:MAG: HAD family phosphatase [Akkermansiaceae bacterium]|nr:HAD family phosphatase [Akkermansiaceae bacterium]
MEPEQRIVFPDNGFDGLIFDLDGTLVDSMPAHFEAWCRALEAHGAGGIFPEDVFYAMGGMPTKDIVVELNGEHGLNLNPEAVCYAKREAYLASLDRVILHEEVVTFARAQYGKVPLGVATGSTRLGAEKTLQAVGLSDLFDEVVTSEDVPRGKPAPDIFLEAARRIGVEPGRCLAIEDAQPGLLAAQAAGMKVVMVPAPLRVV